MRQWLGLIGFPGMLQRGWRGDIRIHHLHQQYQGHASSASPHWVGWWDNHRDNGKDLWWVAAPERLTAQRIVHSTSEHDGMEGICEPKHNSHYTTSWNQSNPGSDVCQRIVDNVSMKPWMAVIHVWVILWGCCVFESDTLQETCSESVWTCLIIYSNHIHVHMHLLSSSWSLW